MIEGVLRYARAGRSDAAEALAVDVEMNTLLGEATGNLMYQLVTNLFTRLIERLGDTPNGFGNRPDRMILVILVSVVAKSRVHMQDFRGGTHRREAGNACEQANSDYQ